MWGGLASGQRYARHVDDIVAIGLLHSAGTLLTILRSVTPTTPVLLTDRLSRLQVVVKRRPKIAFRMPVAAGRSQGLDDAVVEDCHNSERELGCCRPATAYTDSPPRRERIESCCCESSVNRSG